jgi:uncharacterized coiled-coil DUF342 family protein
MDKQLTLRDFSFFTPSAQPIYNEVTVDSDRLTTLLESPDETRLLANELHAMLLASKDRVRALNAELQKLSHNLQEGQLRANETTLKQANIQALIVLYVFFYVCV